MPLHGSMGKLRRLSQGKGQQLKNGNFAAIRRAGQKENSILRGLD